MEAVFQTTSDGKTWDNPVALDTASVAGNRVFTTSWFNAPNSFKRGERVGVFASQSVDESFCRGQCNDGAKEKEPSN